MLRAATLSVADGEGVNPRAPDTVADVLHGVRVAISSPP